MRTTTFLGICSFIGGAIIILLQIAADFLGFHIPYFDSIIFNIFKLAIVVPIVAVTLNPLNQKIRILRKRGGRDIEEEEKYETESGFISLVEKDKK